MRVLVTDGDNRAALAVTRALGRRGHEVLVAERRSPSLAQTSRYCAKRLVYPDPVADDAAFVDYLSAAVATENVKVLLPIADITTGLVTANRDRFEPACQVPFADAAAIARASNKVEMMRSAARLGVPMPRTWYRCSAEEGIPEELCYPVVIKPHRSRVRTDGGWMSCSVGYAGSREELQAAILARPRHEFPVMLQERIAGPGVGIFVCYDHGKMVAVFSHRRLREKPPWGGVSVLCESTEVPADAKDYAERLLADLNWHGVAMVEFKRDERDGMPKLMEINARFWGSLQLAIDAGVDFPNILLDTCRGATGGPMPSFRAGVKSRWLWGDFDSLLLRLRARKGDWPTPDGRGPLPAIVQFLRLGGKDLRYDNPRRDDVRPWLFETRRRLWPW
jgi:predicted ATP-grasp superfamily ATP-dependent carboligase